MGNNDEICYYEGILKNANGDYYAGNRNKKSYI